MEHLLFWWDELDDFAHACRHLATSACAELSELATTAWLATGLAALGAWPLLHLLP